MSQKKRGLGKSLGDLGLSALLTEVQQTQTAVVTGSADPAQSPSSGKLQEVPVDKISPGRYQPRRHFDPSALEELAQSIRAQGVIQPIVLRRMNNGYEIVAGERRWRAAQLAELQEIPAIIRDISDEAAMAMALIENIQRSNLNAIEEANALQRLITEFGLTHQEVAEAVGKSRTLVTNLLRLLKLNPDVRALVEKGLLEMGHARALLTLQEGQQSEAASHIVARGLSVRQTEELVRQLTEGKSSFREKNNKIDPNIKSLQKRLSEQFGASVIVNHTAKGKGKLVIQYHSLDELDGILEKIGLTE